MKDLSIYFENQRVVGDFKPGQLGTSIVQAGASFYQDSPETGIALLFVPAYDKLYQEQNSLVWVHDFRKAFYGMFGGDWKVPLFDLGIINPGQTPNDTYSAVKEVVSELVKSNILPLVIGGSQDLTFPIYQAYERLEQTVNLLAVDPSLDLGDPDEELVSNAWLNKIIAHQPNFLFNFSLVAYQSYLTNPREIKLLDDLYFDAFRLGEFYSNERMIEPQLRNSDILSFDMTAIRSSDYKSNQRNLPHGLYGEDACRIMRYAGMSDKLSVVGLFNFLPKGEGYESDVNLISQMLWYFIEGFNLRKQDYPIGSKRAYLKYRVNIDDFKDEIIFYKSNKSGRWWLEVPYPKIQGVKLQRHLLVPCDYEDYENALKNELPNLWLRTYKKLV